MHQAAELLAAARRQRVRIERLPEAARPSSAAEAMAVQDEIVAALGGVVVAYKGSAGQVPVRAPILAGVTYASPARFPVADAPQCGVEGEVAFRFVRDMPARAEVYGRDEVAAALEACAAIEVVTSRFADPDAVGPLEKLADSTSNGGFVHGSLTETWRGLDLATIRVTMLVNDEVAVDQAGGLPSGDPLGVAVAVAEMLRGGDGVKAGLWVTCGSYTGLRYLRPGDRCVVAFEGLGQAELVFVA